jgi:hypothetical protein
MTTTGFADGIGPYRLSFRTNDASGRQCVIPAAVMTNEAGESFSATNPIPSQPAYKAWASLNAATTYDATSYGLAEFDFSNINGHTISILRDSSNPPTKSLTGFYDQNGGGPYTTITANGVYQFIGGGYMQWTVTGGTGTATCNARAAQ